MLVLLLFDGLVLGTVVLLQSGKGGGLASMGGGAGTDTLIGGRQAATILTKASWICGAAFMVLALFLSVLSSRQARPTSVLRDEFGRQTAPAQQQAPAPAQVPGTQPAPQQNTPGSGAPTQPQPNQQR